MSDPAPTSAVIIPFPARAARPKPREEEDPRVRLARALVALDAALAQQRQSVATWRRSLDDLRGSVQGLGTSLAGSSARLGALGEKVAHINAEARKLETWADGVLQQPEGGRSGSGEREAPPAPPPGAARVSE